MSADSDIAVTGRAMKAERQTKRALMKAENTAALTAIGLPFTSHNDGAHLIVHGYAFWVDFWPSTGRWQERGLVSAKRAKGFGLKPMIDAMAKKAL